MNGLPVVVKLIISVIWDLLDLTVGRIPGFGTLFDVVGMILSLILWGPVGIIAVWEVLDVTDQVDAEIPTLTLEGILTLVRGGK